MAHLIDKSALEAEIKKLSAYLDSFHEQRIMEKILFIIDTLEVQEEPVSEDFGEYINELSKQFPEVSFAKVCKIATRTAKWQKQQMMKDAVEVPIVEAVPFGSCKWKLCAKLWLDKGVKGNKVKLIIIKED